MVVIAAIKVNNNLGIATNINDATTKIAVASF